MPKLVKPRKLRRCIYYHNSFNIAILEHEFSSQAVEKSLVVLQVKPWEADTDLEMVWREIIKFEKEGLTWGEKFQLEPIAYGIKMLVMTCSIVDSLILMDDVTEAIEALEDYVQSVTVASMNKI